MSIWATLNELSKNNNNKQISQSINKLAGSKEIYILGYPRNWRKGEEVNMVKAHLYIFENFKELKKNSKRLNVPNADKDLGKRKM